MPNSQTLLKSLKEFGLNPLQWTICYQQPNTYLIRNKQEPEILLRGYGRPLNTSSWLWSKIELVV